MTHNREDDELVRGKTALHCINCDKPTYLTSVSFHAPMCSIECEDTYHDGFIRAVGKTIEDTNDEDNQAKANGKDDDEWLKRLF